MTRRSKDTGRGTPDTADPGAPSGAAPPRAGARCRVHWLDPRCGILAEAATWLVREGIEQEASRTGAGVRPLDLSGFTVVVPGRGAGQRLLEILIERAAAAGRRLIPPATVTLGALPESLYRPARPLADTATETLCWMAALAAAPPRDRELVAPGIGGDPDAPAAPPSGQTLLDAARGLVTLHRELAASALAIATVAAAAEQAIPAFGDHARWEALSRLEAAYLAEIDALGQWDRQTARRVAIERGEVDHDGRIVLVATVDVDPLQRRLLEGVRGRIDALVALPPDIGDDPEHCFDDFGCIVADAWEGRPLPVPLERVVLVDDAEGEAAAVLEWIAAHPHLAPDEITVAVPDAALVPVLEQRFAERGLAARYAAGRSCTRSSPWQLTHAALEWLERREFAALAEIVRAPDAAALLHRRTGIADAATVADAFAGRHLPWQLDRMAPEAAGRGPAFTRLLDAVTGWLEPVAAALAAIDAAARRGGRRPPTRSRAARAEPATALAGGLVAAIRRMWGDLLEGDTIDRDDPAARVRARSLAALGESLAELETLPDRLAAAAGAQGMARLLLDAWGGDTIPPPADPGAIPLVGWLEVALDDAPALVLTGCVEGRLPRGGARDPLLPEPLRQALGLDNATRTAARDAWMMAVAACRAELLVVVPRRLADGSPAVPSRLLFRRPPDGVVAAARRLFARPRAVAVAAPSPPVPSRIAIPRPPEPRAEGDPHQPPMRVTEFRDYLACPYRYWLRHRLGLRAIDDAALELGPAEFGTLIHACLQRFAAIPELASSTDADEIAAGLSAILDDQVAGDFGSAATPAVYVQAELARRRLARLAHVQARRAAEGWRIVGSEIQATSESFVVDGTAVTLSGRIDRIDHHAGEGKLQIIDYKTSAAARDPDATHRDKGTWVDLQLPLYRHLVGEVADLPRADAVELGYCIIPARLEDVGFAIAPWTAADLTAADDAATEVVRLVRRGVFWPLTPDARGFPEFDAICQTHVIRDDEEVE
ncbi:MAG: PD-(D/E)XK nuclease family protein [Planctomycetaceae bacterium]